MTLRPCRPGECKRSELADWGIYRDCFPRGIELTDIDGMVEVGGRFVFIDRKKDTDNPANFRRGQELAYDRLAMKDGVTVITEIVHNDDTHVWRIRRWPRECSGWRWLTRPEAREWMTQWARWAEGGASRPPLEPGVLTDAPASYLIGA